MVNNSAGEKYFLTDKVAIPYELLDDFNSNSLVIFAGAGVSKSFPSDLPNFEELTEKLGEMADTKFCTEDDSAQFLGELSNFFNVHKHVQTIISNPKSEPNSLHKAIVNLMSSNGNIRIVTTNYDNHFSNAAQQLDIALENKWAAPALPIGSNFSGLVHIHGSIQHGPDDLVVTDKDLGKAYLFDAWAARFLIRMFETYTVVFIGFSHNDPMMRYLGLALSSNRRRYVFIEESDADNEWWKRLNIFPISYPNNAGNHGEVLNAIESWASLTRMGVTEHRVRMVEIAHSDFPLSYADSSYVAQRISLADGIDDFVEATSSLELDAKLAWINWAEDQAIFRSLFNGQFSIGSSWGLAKWFADNYVAEPSLSDRALQTFQRLGMELSEKLFAACTSAVEKLSHVDQTRARRWKAVLASSVSDRSSRNRIQQLLVHQSNDSEHDLFSIFRCLTPRYELRQGISFNHKTDFLPYAEVHFELDEHYLSPVVRKLTSAEYLNKTMLINALENTLLMAYHLMEAWYGDSTFDVLNYSRSAIEDHEQDEYRNSLSPIVDGLRDLAIRSTEIDSTLVDRWLTYERALFRRLAIFLIGNDSVRSSDEKILWILEHNFLFDHQTKHEVFALLKSALPTSSREVREKLLNEASSILNSQNNSNDEELNQYEVVNLLFWIVEITPDWTQATNMLAELRDANPTFEKREHPDFNHWASGASSFALPSIPLQEMLERLRNDPLKLLNEIDSLSDDLISKFNPTRNGALATLKQAISAEPKSGITCLRLPNLKHPHDMKAIDHVAAVLEGWSDAEILFPLDEYLEELRLVTKGFSLPDAVSRLLLSLVSKEKQEISKKDHQVLRSIATDLFKTHFESFKRVPVDEALAIAPLYINSWPGYLANFWIFSISRRWTADKESWTGLNEEELNELSGLLNEGDPTFNATLPAIASHLLFLFSADSEFCKSKVMPYFDQASSQKLAWHPFLHAPRVNSNLLISGFLDITRNFFPSLDHLHGEQVQRNFLEMVFDICSTIPIDDYERQSFLNLTLSSGNGKFAVMFAEVVVSRLHRSVINPVEVWEKWLKTHIQNRLDGIPRTSSNQELEMWAEVVSQMETGISEAIMVLSENTIGIGGGSSMFLKREALTNHGVELLNYFETRIRNSVPDDMKISWVVQSLIRIFSEELGEANVQPLVRAASDRRLL